MKRYGPLHSAEEGVLLGDPTRRHLLLASGALQHRNDANTLHQFRWKDIDGVSLTLPTTRFRFPGFLSGVAFAALAAIIQEDPNLGPEAGTAHVLVDDASHVLSIDRHHFGGYWAPVVQATQRMIDRLVSEPSSRTLLDHPDDLLRAVAESARRASGMR